MSKILVLNGPNLGRLGSREPEVYGTATIDDVRLMLQQLAGVEVELDIQQTDDEAELIAWIHQATDRGDDVILNPAAFTHYSYALRDACAAHTAAGHRLVEVHLTNPHQREGFRSTSVISGVASGVVSGFGADSYRVAFNALLGR